MWLCKLIAILCCTFCSFMFYIAETGVHVILLMCTQILILLKIRPRTRSYSNTDCQFWTMVLFLSRNCHYHRWLYPKTLYDGAQEMRVGREVIRFSVGSAYSFGIFIFSADMMPVEKHRDHNTWWLIFLSIAQYALPPDLLNLVMNSDPNERDAWLLGYTKSSQQKLK